MGYYILDSHEVGPRGKLALVEAIPGAVEAEFTPTEWDWRDRSTYPVCWVDNGTFQAVGIAIDKKELDRFTTGMNGRPFKWFFIPTEELVKLKPALAEYLRGEKSWR